MNPGRAPAPSVPHLQRPELHQKYLLARRILDLVTRHAQLPEEEHKRYTYMAQKQEQQEKTLDIMKIARVSEAIVAYEIGRFAVPSVALQVLHIPEDDVLNGADVTILLSIKNSQGKNSTLPITLDVGYGRETMRSKASDLKWDLNHGGARVQYPQPQQSVPKFIVGFSMQNLQRLARLFEATLAESTAPSTRESGDKTFTVMRSVLWHQIQIQLEAMLKEQANKEDKTLFTRLEQARAGLTPIFQTATRVREQAEKDENFRWLFACHAYKEIQFSSEHYEEIPANEPKRQVAREAVDKYEEFRGRREKIQEARKAHEDAHITQVSKALHKTTETGEDPKNKPKRSTLTLKNPPQGEK